MNACVLTAGVNMKNKLIVEVKIEMEKMDQDEILDLATLIKREADKIDQTTKHNVRVSSYFTTEEGLSCKL